MRRFFRPIRVLILAAALLLALVIGSSPAGRWAERALDPIRFAAALRPSSGQIVIVEMDAASVAAIHQWPWSRQHYAAVVDRLVHAGAASIAFDVDLSSKSNAADDAELAKALANAGGRVVLPTFAQRAGAHDVRSIDTLPLPIFRAHAALASVNVAPDDDGIVRRMPFGTVTDSTPRPSLAAFIGNRSGVADNSFRIAFGIDPATIPRLSFIDVRDGRFDPAAVRGRNILIGATAIEMGDRYATPVWGVIPGVVIQALAAESLLPGLPYTGSSILSLIVGLAVGAFVLRLSRLRIAVLAAIIGVTALLGIVVVAQVRYQYWALLAPGLVVIATTVLGRTALHLARKFDHQRCTDEVTGLPNRMAMIRAPLSGPYTVGVALFANLEPLLTVLGQAAERDLVMRLAERLRLAAGDVDIFRIADRQFAFTLPVEGDGDELPARLRAMLLKPIEVNGRRVDPAIHIGVTDEQGLLTDRLTAAAHAAEQAAEASTFWHHGTLDRAMLEQKVSLMGELDHAIATGQIEVHYQPKLALAADRITSVEALVRWRHPDRGMIRPDLFIPLAEQADRIGPLTLFVLDRVTRDIAAWNAMGLTLSAAINVSARLLSDVVFGDALRAVLSAGRISPASLILEVTESATINAPERAAQTLCEYRDLGCAISMDDYGTGQSTLSYLQWLPLSELKIDRSFVQHAHLNHADGLMVRSTIDLAHGLGLKVVAEGIEDEGCLAFLRDAGCDMAQGYLISRPLPRNALEELLLAGRLAA
ncbi:putative bifunctional diguanylate cyclase/phosphodiesterase [Sphingomonas sp. 1P08PE]|uniref:putative bifunctional diguanylate cyclase/phosphodiesterase n=1 Tax=Sphingomonas sp. 1P08PE TaxID=554122 RepID=UPI0039A34BBE